ncbi:hypothetical protein H7F33_09940 [Pedobacter sp. PAMC26386]|nr:hypothetical protein H7F33_09940 [Pedobacter sp. PAMC26386]
MPGHSKITLYALVISFLGSLPLGTLNLSVANFVFKDNIPGAIAFAIAAIVVEIVLVRIALVTVNRLEGLKRFYKLFNIVTCLILIVLSMISLNAAYNRCKFEAGLPFSNLNPFLSGLLLSVINPLHLPFWMGWTAVLKSKNILDHSLGSYNVYVAGIGIGTSLAFLTYGTIGHLLITNLLNYQILLNWLVGITLLLTALIQFYKTFFTPIKKLI